jgi:hypothetical protein
VLLPRKKCQASIITPARPSPAADTTSSAAGRDGTPPSGLNSTAIRVPAAARIAAAREMTGAIAADSGTGNTVSTHGAPTAAAARASSSAFRSTASSLGVTTRAVTSWQRSPAAARVAAP